jgi:ribonuclease D
MPDKTDIITKPEDLDRAVESLVVEERVSLDVESDGFYNYSESVCIITLSSPHRNFIVDSQELGEAAKVLEKLTSRADSPLLMHSGQNDVLALKRDFGLEFGMVHDTAVAAMLLGLPQTGLAALVESYLGLTLEKELQRHDWSRRPIEPDHLRYLINDTQHLFELHDLMWDELSKLELTEEYALECLAVAAAVPKDREFDPERFRRVKGHGSLTDTGRGVLRSIYAWRDNVAREVGRAPFRVMSDSTMLELARNCPTELHQLREQRGVGEWIVEGYGETLLEAIRTGLSEPAPVRPPRRPTRELPQRMDARQRDLLGRLKRWRENERERRGVGLQAVLPTAVLQELILNPPADVEELAKVPRVGRARAERYGQEILEIVKDQ